MHRPFRFITFPERPEALLIVAPEGSAPTFAIPPLPVPFTKAEVAYALGMAGHEARVTEESPGRWDRHLRQAHHNETAERRSIIQRRQATEVALAAGSPVQSVRDRGALLKRKVEVDASVVELKAQVGAAKSAVATRGEYLPPAAFRILERTLTEKQAESQAIQFQLSELKREAREKNVADHAVRAATFGEKFIAAAKSMLDEDEFQALVDEANGVDEAEAAE